MSGRGRSSNNNGGGRGRGRGRGRSSGGRGGRNQHPRSAPTTPQKQRNGNGYNNSNRSQSTMSSGAYNRQRPNNNSRYDNSDKKDGEKGYVCMLVIVFVYMMCVTLLYNCNSHQSYINLYLFIEHLLILYRKNIVYSLPLFYCKFYMCVLSCATTFATNNLLYS